MRLGTSWNLIVGAGAALLCLAIVGITLLLVQERGDSARAARELGLREQELAQAQSELQQALGQRDPRVPALEQTRQQLEGRNLELSGQITALEEERDQLHGTVEFLQQGRRALLGDNTSAAARSSGPGESLPTTDPTAAVSAQDSQLSQEPSPSTEIAPADTLQEEGDSLAATLDSLQAERDGLAARIESLQAERDGLAATVESLQGSGDGTAAPVDALRAERDGLAARVQSLQASYTALSDENSGLKAALRALEADKLSLETQVEEFQLAHESLAMLEERAEGLRAVIAALEEDRQALVVMAKEMFPTCTGSMEPRITCLDTAVVLQNFRPEDIALDNVIAYYPPGQEGTGDGSPVFHRVTDIKVEDNVHYFWPRGDALDEPDGVWVPEGNVLGYLIELRPGTRPENSALRARVNGARELYESARDRMLEARGGYDDLAVRHCGSVEAVSTCSTISQEGRAELRAAYDVFSGAWGEYVNATCGYDEAFYHGLHESQPSTGQPFGPYVAPSLCSQ